MSDEPAQISILDSRLAEIDKRLRTIQTGLVTEARSSTAPETTSVPAPPEPPALPPRVEVPESGAALRAVPPPAPGDALADAIDELRELAASHQGLLASMRALLADYERALADARGGSASPGGQPLMVTAGPFASTDAVRGFERALSALPGVSGVELRGYEGGDRAIVDVHLSASTS